MALGASRLSLSNPSLPKRESGNDRWSWIRLTHKPQPCCSQSPRIINQQVVLTVPVQYGKDPACSRKRSRPWLATSESADLGIYVASTVPWTSQNEDPPNSAISGSIMCSAVRLCPGPIFRGAKSEGCPSIARPLAVLMTVSLPADIQYAAVLSEP
jgi:hypothetical protein